MPGGLSAAGRSSKNPATACKVEEKKRGKGARTDTQGGTAACPLSGNLCACNLHTGAYSLGRKYWQALAYPFAIFTKRASASISPPATNPQKAPEIPAKETPDAVTRKVMAAASRDSCG